MSDEIFAEMEKRIVDTLYDKLGSVISSQITSIRAELASAVASTARAQPTPVVDSVRQPTALTEAERVAALDFSPGVEQYAEQYSPDVQHTPFSGSPLEANPFRLQAVQWTYDLTASGDGGFISSSGAQGIVATTHKCTHVFDSGVKTVQEASDTAFMIVQAIRILETERMVNPKSAVSQEWAAVRQLGHNNRDLLDSFMPTL